MRKQQRTGDSSRPPIALAGSGTAVVFPALPSSPEVEEKEEAEEEEGREHMLYPQTEYTHRRALFTCR